MTTQSKVVLGILGGLAAGITLGLLFAPEKGSEIRKRVSKTAGGWMDSLGHLFSGAEDGGLAEKAQSKTSKDIPVTKS